MKFPNFVRIASLPFVQIVDINETASIQKEVFDHYEAGLVKIISEKLKFSYDTIIPRDREWGIPMSNGNWSGMVGLLQRNETDLIICSLSITEARSRVMGFSYPYVIDSLVFATRQLEKSIDEDAFLKPFSTTVWIYLCVTILFLHILHSILFRGKPTNACFQKSYRNILQQPVSAPESLGEYIFRYYWWIFQVVLRWSYAAVLLSCLTIPSLTGARNIPELANAFRRGEVQCTAYPGTNTGDTLLNSADADSKTVGQCVNESPGHPDFDVVLSNSQFSKRLAYIGRRSRFVVFDSLFFISEDDFYPRYTAIGIQKNFCCKDQLDSTIHSLVASGIYHKLQKDYYRKNTYKVLSSPARDDGKVERRRLSLGDLQGAFILLASGYSLAILVFLLEVVCKKSTRFKLS